MKCESTAKWAICPYDDINEAMLACDEHVVPFMREAAEGDAEMVLHVNAIPPSDSTPICRWHS